MKTWKITYEVKPYYCLGCKALYFTQVDCKCDLQAIKRIKHRLTQFEKIETKKVPVSIELKKKDGTIVKLKARKIVRASKE